MYFGFPPIVPELHFTVLDRTRCNLEVIQFQTTGNKQLQDIRTWLHSHKNLYVSSLFHKIEACSDHGKKEHPLLQGLEIHHFESRV